jgi:dipeptidyl aminopeptidase/acylaminoacyl peptidase
MKALSIVFVAVSVFVGVHGQTSWSPEHHLRVKAVGSASLSPDGSRILYTVTDEVMAPDKSEYVTQIWMATADGRGNLQMTFADKSSTNPKWSPDGRWIAFTSSRKERNQLYLMNAAGGEAQMITEGKSAVGTFEWSPDGRWIAVTMTDAKSEDEEKNDKARNDFRWIDENTKLARLYVLPLQKDASGKRPPRKLTSDSRSVTNFDWSPDGTRIAFSHVSDPRAGYWPTSDISVIDVANGSVKTLAATAAAETSPKFSRDGRWIALSVSDGPVRWAQSNRIHIVPSDGGEASVMPISHDGQPNIVGWSGDNSRVLFTESKGTGTSLYEAVVSSRTIREADHQNAVITSVSMTKNGDIGAFVMQTASKPQEVYILRPGDGITQISNINSEIAKMPVGKTELVKWKSKDGREIEGLLTYPLNYTAGAKVPLILNIHGGPAGVFNQSFIGNRGVYPIATFSAKGYAILRPNPRGSSGYGTEFRRANIKDWGGMDYQDLMTGVDHVISLGVADPERLGVMGWSYGGYMTSWIVTQTKRFKAASAGAPVTNLMSFNGTADIPGFVPDYFGGQSWDIPEVYAKHSAMFNIKGVSTPTLIQHGEADVRVPISQGYEFYNALKQQGVTTRMIVLPRQPHGPNEPRMQLAAMQSNLDWFDKYLK